MLSISLIDYQQLQQRQNNRDKMSTEEQLWRTLLESPHRVQMNSATADIVINMLNVKTIQQFVEKTTEDQAKGIAEAVKSAARALPDASRPPTINIQVTIPEDAALDADQRRQAIEDAIQQAEAAETARKQLATTTAMGTVPYVSPESATMYHAVWYWATLQTRMGVNPTAANAECSANALNMTIARLRYEREVAGEVSNVKPPGTLKNLNKFREWWEQWYLYMRSKRGAARIPLVYVVREHEVPTAECRAKSYSSTDEMFINLFTLADTYYEVDNKTVFHELNSLLIGGPLESIAKKYEKTEDGRNAVIAITKYANGDDAKMARTNAALKTLESTSYHRCSQNFTLDDFFSRLRKNYEILEAAGEGLQESMKVSQVMGKITEPTLAIAKSVVMTQVKGTTTFEEVVTLLKSAVLASTAAGLSGSNQRQVSDIHKPGAGEQPKAAAKKTINDSDLHYKTYSPQEWKKLTREQQNKVRSERKKLALEKKRKKERESSSTEKEEVKDEPGGDDSASGQAGAQFGRGGAKKAKSKV